MINPIARVTLAFLLLLAVSAGCTTNKAPRANRSSSRLASDMIGSWVMVGTPGNIEEAPEKGGRFKYRTGTHWVVFSVNEETGLVTEIFGGSYTMNGEEYIETQEYADYRWIEDNGKSFTFKVKIEGDLMTQLGIGNSYNEVWKRVK